MCAALRRISSSETPLERLGIAEKPKISARPDDHGKPERDGSGNAHGPMIGSPETEANGEGTRCESGTVPPL